MEYYKSYMDRQEISPAFHEKLLDLEPPKKRPAPWLKYGALAACAALIISVGMWRLTPERAASPTPDRSSGQFASDYTPPPEEKDVVDWDDLFVVQGPADAGQAGHFYMMPAIRYPDITNRYEVDMVLDWAYARGSFREELEKEDIQRVFWGPEGKPEAADGDLPWALSWGGYTLRAHVWYSPEGKLLYLYLAGEKGGDSFALELCPGSMPPACCIDMERGDELSEFNGVKIAGWSKAFDRNGDGITDYICGSEFMTSDEIGIRFENSGGSLEDASRLNTLFVRQVLIADGGLYLDHLAVAEHIPAWREEEFSTLEQARQEADFAPYLPSAEPSDYGEFYGRLSYQEGARNMLFVRWSRGYDNVEVCVYRDGYRTCNLVSPDKPETYDLRRYPIPWCDSVPAEYRETVSSPAFRAEDMSLAIVETRGREHDAGGTTYSFDVLHPDGALVSYRCDGMTAQQVWALVEETL